MDFIKDYLLYNSGNMSPRRYHIWSAFAILSMAVGRRCYIEHNYFQITTMQYICLVGRMGIRKSSAMNNAQNMFTKVYPDYPIGASVMSREKIVERMASDERRQEYADHTNTVVPWTPTAFFINELKNFMSINPAGMVEFLTDIYDKKFFDADTIKHGLQPIVNPCINILACETPKWIIEKLKLNIIAGGFSRRLMYVYETVRPPRITFPFITKEMYDARDRCEAHLAKLSTIAGEFKWESQATKDWFDNWFKKLETPDDEIMEGFYEAKDVIVQKVAMLLALSYYNPQLVLTKDLLQLAIAHIEAQIEDNLPRLTAAAGRNELAVPMQSLLSYVDECGGEVSLAALLKRTEKDMNGMEQTMVMKHLKETGQIVQLAMPHNGAMSQVVISERRCNEMRREGLIEFVNTVPQYRKPKL